MPDNAKKGITVKVAAELHAEVSEYVRNHGMTMSEFVAQALDNELHPKITEKEGNDIVLNGACLTADITFPNSENGCTLSDILMTDVPEKYFLSQAAMRKISGKLSAAAKDSAFTTRAE